MFQKEDLAFNYFEDNYRWSRAFGIGLSMSAWGGSEIGELHRIGLSLRDSGGDDDAWVAAWGKAASSVYEIGMTRKSEGKVVSGKAYLHRASVYAHLGERFAQPKDSKSAEIYKLGVTAFKEASDIRSGALVTEIVEIPFEDSSLPGVLVGLDPALRRSGRLDQPLLICFDGLDITKELQFFLAARDLAERGIALLIVDGPGNGEAIRFRDMPLRPDTESYATACLDWALRRDDVNKSRVGVLGISLGGYFAVRAAAFESRFACCVAWGAQWDYQEIWRKRLTALSDGESPSLSVDASHLSWILGLPSGADPIEALAEYKLDGAAQLVQCPTLILHGEGDEQIPVADAVACFDAIGASDKTLKVFDREEGGYHHCSFDNLSHGTAVMWDWVAAKLGG